MVNDSNLNQDGPQNDPDDDGAGRFYFELTEQAEPVFEETQKYLSQNYGVELASKIGRALAAISPVKFQALEERSKTLPAVADNFSGQAKAVVISALGDLSDLARRLSPGSINDELNNNLIPLLKVFGDKINPDLIDGVISFLEHENSGYKNNKEQTISAIKNLARSFGDSLTAESFSIVLGTSLRVEPKNSTAASMLKSQLIPFILLNQHDLGREKIQFMMEKLPNSALHRALLDDPLFSSIGRLINISGLDLDAQELRSSTDELELIAEEFSHYLGASGISTEMAKFIHGAGAALTSAKIKDARMALQSMAEIGVPPSGRASFFAVSAPLIIQKLGVRYNPGDIEAAARDIFTVYEKSSLIPSSLQSAQEIVPYMSMLNRVFSCVGDTFTVKDVTELCESMVYLSSKFQDQKINGYFAATYGVLPALSNLQREYHAGLLRELTDCFYNELSRANLDAHASYSFLTGLGNAIACLKPGIKADSIGRIADSVNQIAKIDTSTGKNFLVPAILIPAMKSLSGKLTYEDLLTLTGAIKDLSESLYSPARLKNSLPRALQAVGLEKGLTLHKIFLQNFIEPRLEFLSEREIQELYYILYVSRDSGQLIQGRTKQVLAGREPSDALSKVLALDLVKAEAKDELDAPTIGAAISEAIRNRSEAGLAKPLGIDMLTDRSEDLSNSGFSSNFRLTITRGLLDALHGAFEGKPLSHNYTPQTTSSDYQSIRILGDGGELYGLINTRGLQINGRRSLVVTKIDLCQNSPVNFPGSTMIDRVFLTLKIIAQRNGLDLYLNSGGANWPEEGGIMGSNSIRHFCRSSFKDTPHLDLRENSPSYPELNNQPLRYLVRIQKTDK